MTRLLFAVTAAFVLCTGCGKKGVGETCTDSNECTAPSTCILGGGKHIANGTLTCVDTNKLCSMPCATDADCSALGAGHICINECFQGSCLQGTR